MRIRLNPTPAAAVMLTGVAVLCAVIVTSAGRRDPPAAGEASPLPTPLGISGRMALERCRDNVSIIHDVHWAAACVANAEEENAKRSECLRTQTCDPKLEPPDDSTECTLPPSRAFVLNNARSVAENMCLDEAAAIERGT